MDTGQLSAGKKDHIPSDRLFAILVVMALVTTFMTGSVLQKLYVEYFITKQAKLAMTNKPEMAAEIRLNVNKNLSSTSTMLPLYLPMATRWLDCWKTNPETIHSTSKSCRQAGLCLRCRSPSASCSWRS